MEITALVGESIPQVAFGLALIIIIIILYGRMADKRKWRLGFYVVSFSLIIMGLCEGVIVLSAFLEYSDRESNTEKYWNGLDDYGKTLIMANWQCCGWSTTCDTETEEGIYWFYRAYEETRCYDATASDYKEWNDSVMLYFGIFAGFHILYTFIPCVGQAKRRQIKIKREIKREVTREVNTWKMEDMIRKHTAQVNGHGTNGDVAISIPRNVKVIAEPEQDAYQSPSDLHRERFHISITEEPIIEDPSAPLYPQRSPSTSDDAVKQAIEPVTPLRNSVSLLGVSRKKSLSEDDESHRIDQQDGGSSDEGRNDRLKAKRESMNEPSIIAIDVGRGKHKPNNLSVDSNAGQATPSGMSTSMYPVWGDYKEQPKPLNLPGAVVEGSENSNSEKDDDEDGAESTSKEDLMMDDRETETNVVEVAITYNQPNDMKTVDEQKIERNAEESTKVNVKPPPPPKTDMNAKASLHGGDSAAKFPPPPPVDVNKERLAKSGFNDEKEDGGSASAQKNIGDGDAHGAQTTGESSDDKKDDVNDPLEDDSHNEENARKKLSGDDEEQHKENTALSGQVPPAPPLSALADVDELKEGRDQASKGEGSGEGGQNGSQEDLVDRDQWERVQVERENSFEI